MGIRDRLRRDKPSGAPGSARNHSRASQSPGSSVGPRSSRSTYESRTFYSSTPPSALINSQRVAETAADVKGVIRIAFCGGRDIGKSALINAVAHCHIAGGRHIHPEGDRFTHPKIQDVLYYEIPLSVIVKKDVAAFDLVVIIFQGNVKENECDLANKCRLAHVPFCFAHTKADLTFRRLHNFSKRPVAQVVKMTRETVNDKPHMKWFQLKEVDQKCFLLSVPDLARRNIHSLFDEVDFLYFVESFYSTTVPVDSRFTSELQPQSGDFAMGGGLGHEFKLDTSFPSQMRPGGDHALTSSFEDSAAVSTPTLKVPKSSTRGRNLSRDDNNSAITASTASTPPTKSILKSPTGRHSASHSASNHSARMPTINMNSSPPTDSNIVGSPGRTPFHSTVFESTAGGDALGTPLTPGAAREGPQGVFTPSPERLSIPENETSRSKAIPPIFGDSVKVAFIEEPATSDSGKRATLLEAFLGGSREQVVKSVASGVGYKHSEYPNAKFFYYDARSISPEGVPDFFVQTLSGFGLLILAYTKVLPESLVAIGALAKRHCLKFVLVHCRPSFKEDQLAAADKNFSPRHPLRKLKELANKDAKSALARVGVKEQDYSIFEISRRLLRLPDGYPRADEEEFKDCIAENAGGRIGPAPAEHTPPASPSSGAHVSGTDSFITSSRHLGVPRRSGSADFGTPVRSNGIIPGRANGTPTPVLKKPQSQIKILTQQQAAEYGSNGSGSGRGTPQSVTWLNPQTVHVAVVGHNQVGKSTLINGTFKQNVASVGRPHNKLPHRHPEYYDLVFEDIPGYEASMTKQEAERWIQKQRLEAMDWIIVVFQSRLGPTEVQLAQMAEIFQIPLVFVATAVDMMVESYMFDENLMERAAVEKARRWITGAFNKTLDEVNMRPFPLFIVSGKAMSQQGGAPGRQKSVPLFFDETSYLDFIEQEVAGSL